MTIDFKFEEDKTGDARDAKIFKILAQFSRLSPEKQAAVMEFIEYLERKAAQKAGQDPVA